MKTLSGRFVGRGEEIVPVGPGYPLLHEAARLIKAKAFTPAVYLRLLAQCTVDYERNALPILWRLEHDGSEPPTP